MVNVMRQNIDPAIWGPAAWAFLRHSASACNKTCADSYQTFFQLLPEVLPCEQCRVHAGAYIAANPVDTDNLVAWVDRFQKAVAERKASAAGGALKTTKTTPTGGCLRCAGPSKMRAVILVAGAALTCVVLALLIIGLVKLTKASRTK